MDEINRIFGSLAELSDDELKDKTEAFKQRLREATRDGRARRDAMLQSLEGDVEDRAGVLDELAEVGTEIREIEARKLDEILPEAYAVFKESCRRLVGKSWERAEEQITWGDVPYDVQLIGGVVLHQGKVAEMATGEGKTLTSGMPLYLNGFNREGCASGDRKLFPVQTRCHVACPGLSVLGSYSRHYSGPCLGRRGVSRRRR